MDKLHDALPEDIRNHPTMVKFDGKSAADLAQSYIELERWKSGAVKLPTEDSPKEDWEALPEKFAKHGVHLTPVPDFDNEDQVAAFQKAIGVPEDINEYEVDELPDDAAERFRKMAKDMSLTKAQAKRFFDSMKAIAADAEQAQNQSAQEQTEALKLAWGADKDKRIARIMKVAQDEVGQEVTLNAAGMMLVDKLLAKLEGTPQGHELAAPADPGDTLDELTDKMSELRQKIFALEPGTERNKAREKFMKYQQELERLSP